MEDVMLNFLCVIIKKVSAIGNRCCEAKNVEIVFLIIFLI